MILLRGHGMGGPTLEPCYLLPWAQQYACSLRNSQAEEDYMVQNGLIRDVHDPNYTAQAGQSWYTPPPAGTQVYDYDSRVTAIVGQPTATPPPAGSQPVMSVQPAPAPAPPPSSPAPIAPGVLRFNNNTGGDSQHFRVGDGWTITITGASPYQPVVASASQNQQSSGEQKFGQTDANGNFSLSGVMQPSHIGGWAETWKVGGQVSGVLVFNVTQAPGPTPAQTTNPPSYTNTPPPNPGAPPPDPGGYQTEPPAPTGSGLMNFITRPVEIAGHSIPIWAFGAVALPFLFRGNS